MHLNVFSETIFDTISLINVSNNRSLNYLIFTDNDKTNENKAISYLKVPREFSATQE